MTEITISNLKLQNILKLFRMDINQKLSSLQEISKAQLSKILSSVPGTKHIVLEPNIIRPLERVCSVKWLK